MTTRSIDMSEAFTPEGINKLKQGQVLIFDFEGSKNEYKITKINKKSSKVWAKPTTLYTEEQMIDKWDEVRSGSK